MTDIQIIMHYLDSALDELANANRKMLDATTKLSQIGLHGPADTVKTALIDSLNNPGLLAEAMLKIESQKKPTR